MKRETTVLRLVVFTLVLFGVVMVYSASAVCGDWIGLFPRQLVYAILGLAIMGLAARFDYHRLADPEVCRTIVLVSGVLLGLVLIPGIGVRVDGGQRWLRLGSFQFQPSELAKFAMVLLLAVKLAQNHKYIHCLGKGYVPPLVIALVFSGAVLLERDLGGPVIMMAAALLMFYVAGARWRHLVATTAPLAVGVLMLTVLVPHRAKRFWAFLDPWADRLDAGFQLIQSLSAFAQGGVWGRGAGASEQKLGYLFAAHTDFIFAVIGEEFGLAGSVTVVLLFGALAFLGYRIAGHAADRFGNLLAWGITGIITLQATFIMAVTIGLLPTKGMPLPFISYGGTSLIVFLGMIGILLNIGIQAHARETKRSWALAR